MSEDGTDAGAGAVRARGRGRRATILRRGAIGLAALAAGGATAAVVAADSGFPITGTAGTVFSGPVAVFNTTCGCQTPTIDWGDGLTGTGSTVLTGASETVSAVHTYTAPGSYVPTVTLPEVTFTTTTNHTVTTAAQISDAPLTVTASGPLTATTGTALSGPVATFVYANPTAGVPSQFTARIDWGDGTALDTGTVAQTSPQHFSVSGSHTYASPVAGTVNVTVTQTDVRHHVPGDGITGATGHVSKPVTVTAPPEPPVGPPVQAPPASAFPGLGIAVPFGQKLLSAAPFTFTAFAGISPAENGPLTYQWDFGDGRDWTDADVANPARTPFQPVAGATDASATHTFAPVFGSGAFYTPVGSTRSVAPTTGEVRHVSLVRVRALDRYGRPSPIVGIPVVVYPDEPPTAQIDVAQAAAGCLPTTPDADRTCPGVFEYDQATTFANLGHDPDDKRFAGDVGERDHIAREQWDVDADGHVDIDRPAPPCEQPPNEATVTGDAAYAALVSAYDACLRRDDGQNSAAGPAAPHDAVAVNFFTRDAGGLPPLNAFPLQTGSGQPIAVPTPYPLTTDQTKTGGQAYLDALQAGAQAKAAAMAGAQARDPSGAPYHGDRSVRVTAYDRSGRSSSQTVTVPIRPRVAPAPVIDVTGARAASDGSQKIVAPIVSDAFAGNGAGTHVTLDLHRTGVDPGGKIAYHVLEIGKPVPHPCAAPNGAGCHKVPDGVLDPGSVVKTIVTAASGKVTLTFPSASDHPGVIDPGTPWSILDTAYDETGAVGRTRYDGFKVVTPSFSCQDVDGQTIGANAAFSGTCVTAYANRQIFTTDHELDVNGLHLRPAEGGVIVVRACAGKPLSISGYNKVPGESCGAPPVKVAGQVATPIGLVVDGAAVASISPTAQNALSAYVDRDDHGAATAPAFAALDSARYHGFPIVQGGGTSDITVTLDDQGGSDLGFYTRLPDVFAPDGTSTAPTARADVPARTVPQEVIVKPYEGLAASLSAARHHAARLKARAADAPVPSFQASDLDLGGLSLPGTITFTYDAATGLFTGDVSAHPFGPDPAPGAELHVMLRDGDFVEADGEVDAPVPLPGITLDRFGLKIAQQPNPKGGKTTQLVASVGFQDNLGGGLIDGTGTVTQQFNPFHLGLAADGRVVILPVHAQFDTYGNGVSFGAHIGKDFGPVSLSADMKGEFGAGGFFISGSGRSCLSIACIRLTGLLSNTAIAGCGEADLVFFSVSAGFGYRFQPHDLDVFLGSCDLSRYQPVTGVGVRAITPSAQPVLAGRVMATSFEVPVPPSLRAVSIVVPAGTHSMIGATPRVGLYEPDKTDAKGNVVAPGALVAATSDILGAEFQVPGKALAGPGTLVEQDPATDVVRFLVPKPKPGKYRVAVLPGSPPVVTPDYAYSDPPVEKGLFTTLRVSPASSAQRHEVKTGKLELAGAQPGISGRRQLSKARAARVLRAATPRYKIDTAFPQSTIPTIPASYVQPVVSKKTKANPLSLVDPSTLFPFQSASMLQVHVAGKLPPGQHVLLVEHGATITQPLEEITANAAGTFDATRPFLPSLTNDGYDPKAHPKGSRDIQTHCLDAYVSDAQSAPRGVVTDAVCFKVETAHLIDPAPVTVDAGDQTATVTVPTPDQLTSNPQEILTLQKGQDVRAIVLSPASILENQAQQLAKQGKAGAGHLRARLARVTRLSPGKRVWRFVVRGLPKGAAPVKVTLTGVRVAGDPRKPGHVTMLVHRRHGPVRIRFHGPRRRG